MRRIAGGNSSHRAPRWVEGVVRSMRKVRGAVLLPEGRVRLTREIELEQLRLPMMLRLREQVTEKLEGERWQFESVERYQPLI